MKLKIKKVRIKPFKGEDGEEIPYAWVTATRVSDDVVIIFGTTNTAHREGEELDLDVEKRELDNGKIGYREVVVS